MSRTYHHGRKAKERLFGFSFHAGCPRHFKKIDGRWQFVYEVDPTPPKRARHQHCWEWMNTPSWWIREFMTAPQRAQTRNMLASIHKVHFLDEVPGFPLAKKPHCYFW